jgi:5-methylcytosine-specific restriction endonuclease McrA
MSAPPSSKRCPTCCGSGETLRSIAFYRHPSRPDGLSSQCRVCHHAVQCRYYDRNTKSERVRTRRRQKGVRARTHELVLQYLEAHPCVNCGEDDTVVLQFHHVRGTRRDNVGPLVGDGYEWPVIEEEIAKCIVLCANCHSRETAISRGHYRLRRAKKRMVPPGHDPAG